MKGVMIQGTSSDAGKSYVATALCRVLSNKGIRVVPFKSQNMSNNSHVTLYGEEIGRAQGVQAMAARVEPSVYMNPILLKPKKNALSEIVLLGHVFRDASSQALFKEFTRTEGAKAIELSKQRLEAEFEVVVIEGAGSPVEINLNDREIVNMYVARAFDVPVILVADIDRGGVFAQIVGTLDLMEAEDRARVKGVIVNKFRGDITLFEAGKKWLEARTGVPILGILPHLEIEVENEDRLSFKLEDRENAPVQIGVLDLPFISNATDLEAFSVEPDVGLKMIRSPQALKNCDALIIPGTKSTQEDLRVFMERGFEPALRDFSKSKPVFGICGGYQMMGSRIRDPQGVDASGIEEMNGFGLFDGITYFEPSKQVSQISGKTVEGGFRVKGFEIHLGRTFVKEGRPLLEVDGQGEGIDLGNVQGTYMHHIFHNDAFRNQWLNKVRKSKGLPEQQVVDATLRQDQAFDKLAEAFEAHVDIKAIERLIDESV